MEHFYTKKSTRKYVFKHSLSCRKIFAEKHTNVERLSTEVSK